MLADSHNCYTSMVIGRYDVRTVKRPQYKILQQGSASVHTESHHRVVNECLGLRVQVERVSFPEAMAGTLLH